MSIATQPSEDPQDIIPILHILRDIIPETLGTRRLETAQQNGQRYTIAKSNLQFATPLT